MTVFESSYLLLSIKNLIDADDAVDNTSMPAAVSGRIMEIVSGDVLTSAGGRV